MTPKRTFKPTGSAPAKLTPGEKAKNLKNLKSLDEVKAVKLDPPTIPNAAHERVEEKLNLAVHELVFAMRHTELDDLEQARCNLMEALENIHSAIDELGAIDP